MKTSKVSKALKEVWAWKEACYRDVKGLPLREALRKRIADAERTSRELGVISIAASKPARVAESQTPYGRKKK